MNFPDDFPTIIPSAFYGRKKVQVDVVREIPSDSEDSELSDDDEVEVQVPHELDDDEIESQDAEDPDNIPDDNDDRPLTQLFGLPPNTRFFFSNVENVTWKSSQTNRDPQDNKFLGECDLPQYILELQSPYSLFKFFMPDDFISTLVEQTCLYGTQRRPDRPLRTDAKQIKQFLGIVIWVSLIRQHSRRRY